MRTARPGQLHLTSWSWLILVEVWFGIIEPRASDASHSGQSKTLTPRPQPSAMVGNELLERFNEVTCLDSGTT